MINQDMERQDTTKKVLAKMRRDIMLYNFKNGEQLKELEIAKKYSCSRASVRGAVVMLQKEGLVNIHKNGTKTVASLSKQDIDDIYELREYLELQAIKRIAKNKKRNFSGVFDVINFVYADTKNIQEQLDIDMAFHTAVIEASENRALVQAWNNIAAIVRELFSFNITESESYAKAYSRDFKEQHIGLMSALLGIDENSGEVLNLFQIHIRGAYNISARVLKKFGMVE